MISYKGLCYHCAMKNILTVTVAIADDHAMIRQTYHIRLKLMGYNVVMEAENGKQLLDKIVATTPPDLCLLDINMPVMDGFETAVQLKKNWPGIKILFFSMHKEPAYIEKALKSGADGFVAKDASSDELTKALRMVISKECTYHH